jgi:hypothetical protein
MSHPEGAHRRQPELSDSRLNWALFFFCFLVLAAFSPLRLITSNNTAKILLSF